MQALKCDRCGSFYESEMRFGECPTAAVDLKGCYHPRYDLCGKCTADFLEWINQEPERNETQNSRTGR